MAVFGIKAEQFCFFIEKSISIFGVDRMVARKDLVVFYSGPSRKVRSSVGRDITTNWWRSKYMADELDGSRIDDTVLGRILGKINLHSFFSYVYAKTADPAQAAADAEVKVWGVLSNHLAKSKFRRAATAVCGADKDRVFRLFELAPLADNPHVQEINNIQLEAVREMKNEVGDDQAFELICRSELKMSYEAASNKNTDESWQDFNERLTFFDVERDATTKGLPKLTAAQEKKKQEIIAKYNLASVYAASPAAWRPASSKPIRAVGVSVPR